MRKKKNRKACNRLEARRGEKKSVKESESPINTHKYYSKSTITQIKRLLPKKKGEDTAMRYKT